VAISSVKEAIERSGDFIEMLFLSKKVISLSNSK